MAKHREMNANDYAVKALDHHKKTGHGVASAARWWKCLHEPSCTPGVNPAAA